MPLGVRRSRPRLEVPGNTNLYFPAAVCGSGGSSTDAALLGKRKDGFFPSLVDRGAFDGCPRRVLLPGAGFSVSVIPQGLPSLNASSFAITSAFVSSVQ